MENIELLRRQQLLDRFLAGDIDKATYDEMVAEIDRLSGAPTNAPMSADGRTSEPLKKSPSPVRPAQPVAPVKEFARPVQPARTATTSVGLRQTTQPITLPPSLPTTGGEGAKLAGVFLAAGGALLVLVVAIFLMIGKGDSLLSDSPAHDTLARDTDGPAAPVQPAPGVETDRSDRSASTASNPAGSPARQSPKRSGAGSPAAATAGLGEALRYRWEAGTSYVYSVEIEADQEHFTETLSGNARYTVAPARGARPSVPDFDPDDFKGTGTAFVVSPDGYLVSCCHVVEAAASVEVSIAGQSYDATVVAVNDDHDLAILKIAAKNLPALPLGNSDGVELGEEVRAVGFPLSPILGESVKATRGTVSGIETRDGNRVLQIDAGINPGNSGGPLLNERGEVIGVNFAKLIEEIGSNVGFAVPINYARQMLGDHGVPFVTEKKKEKLDGPALIKRASAAVALVTVRPNLARLANENTFTLTCQASLVSNRVPRADKPFDPRGLIGMHRFGLGMFGNPLGPMSAPAEIEVDALGRLLRVSGRKSLPWVLGDLSMLVIDPLPGDARKTWATTTACTIILEEPESDRFVPPIGPRGIFGRPDESRKTTLAARQKIVYTLGESSGDNVQIRKRYDLETQDKGGKEPRLQLAGGGEITFDSKAGVPRAMEFHSTFSETTGNTTQRVPITVAYKLLTPEELERLKQVAAKQAAPQPKKPLTEQELKEIIADLEYTTNARRLAADKLAMAEPNERRDEVAKLLEPLLSDGDQFMRSAGAKALGVWGDAESVAALLRLLEDGAHAVRWAAIESLGKLQDEQAAKPLAQCVRANKDRPNASRALQAMGPVAQTAVIGLLDDEDMWVRHEACNILKVIGSKESLPLLKKVTERKHGLDVMAAEAAIKEIASRSSE